MLGRVQLAAMATIGTLVPNAAAVWDPAGYPRDELGDDVITARIARGPQRTTRVRGYSDEPTTIRWTVSGSAVNQRVGLALAGMRFHHDVAAGEADTDVRDALLGVFTADPELLPDVTVTPAGADSIDFDAAGVPGLLWGSRAIGPTASLAATASVDCEYATSIQAMTLEFQAYSVNPYVGAASLLGRLGDLFRHDAIAAREQYGVAFNGPLGSVIPIPALDGAKWQSRATARLEARTRSYSAVAVDVIDTVQISGAGDLSDLSVEAISP